MNYTAEQIAQVCYEANRTLGLIRNETFHRPFWAFLDPGERELKAETVEALQAGYSVEGEEVAAAIVGALTGTPSEAGARPVGWTTHRSSIPHAAEPAPAAEPATPADRERDAAEEASAGLKVGTCYVDVVPRIDHDQIDALKRQLKQAVLPQRQERIPTVGRMVHYVSYGTPGGEYASECRAAIVTEVPRGVEVPRTIGLCVLNPTGQFFNRSVSRDDGDGCAASDVLLCGGVERRGGTWHWPARS